MLTQSGKFVTFHNSTFFPNPFRSKALVEHTHRQTDKHPYFMLCYVMLCMLCQNVALVGTENGN